MANPTISKQAVSEVVFYLCRNCIPQGKRLPFQWTAGSMHVRIKEIPCSGKIDAQYLLHALEGGVRGVCVITCPPDECTLAQGNYRAGVRINTIRRLLEEMGDQPGRAEILHCSSDDSFDHLKGLIDEAVSRFSQLPVAEIKG